MTLSRVLAVAACLLAAGAAHAGSELRGKIDEKVPAIKARLVALGQTGVALGEITGPVKPASNAGPSVVRTLGEALTAAGVRLDPSAGYTLAGSYAAAPNPDDRNLLVVRLTLVLRDPDDRPVRDGTFEIDVIRLEDIVRLLGVNVALTPGGTYPQRNEEIQRALPTPRAARQQTRVKTMPESPYAVEIYARKPGGEARARALLEAPQHPYVELDAGELYEIKLYNGSDTEAAATVSIDGLDAFTFTKDRTARGEPAYTHFLIPPRGSTTVLGWHRTNDPASEENVLRFVTTEYGKGAASAIKATGAIGQITVTFAASWEKGKRPATEKGNVETGFGPPARVNFQAVPREIGAVRDVVTVRYERPR